MFYVITRSFVTANLYLDGFNRWTRDIQRARRFENEKLATAHLMEARDGDPIHVHRAYVEGHK